MTLKPLSPDPACYELAIASALEAGEWAAQTQLQVNPVGVLEQPNASWTEVREGQDLVAIAGIIGINSADRTGVPAVGIAPEWRGKGLYLPVIQALEGHAANTLNLLRLEARCAEGPTTKTLHRAGWKLEGRHPKSRFKNGEYVDTFTLAKFLVKE